MEKENMENNETRSRNFIEVEIDKDLAEGRYDTVCTRFPPEPNGYLHIGHAKSILLNYGLAKEYGGTFHMRFDDTNPTKEREEFGESIKADIQWLGADWGDHLYFASDYFDRMYEAALKLIRDGKAYCLSLIHISLPRALRKMPVRVSVDSFSSSSEVSSTRLSVTSASMRRNL